MNALNRFKKYRDDDLDKVLLLIKSGTIKCGKYANLVKYDKDKKVGKEVFGDVSRKETD